LLSGTDQFGKQRDFQNLKEPNGLVIRVALNPIRPLHYWEQQNSAHAPYS
jgi:hypothetical protein